jgi:hypothetical protein
MARPPKLKTGPKPEGEVRQSQLVTTFGPGAMIDLIDQAVLVSGLDYWGYDKIRGTRVISEPRLRDALVERFRDAGYELSHEAFRAPPVGLHDEPAKNIGVPVVEFPSWFVCQNRACRALVRKDGLESKGGRWIHRCSGAKTPASTVPARFLAACKRGHCEDFPWIRFVHEFQNVERCAAPRLELREGATGDFSEIRVHCACGAPPMPLSKAYASGALRCSGQRPWLGAHAREDCEETVRLLVRTASNSYFSQVVSALSVPEPGKEIEEAIQEHWETLKVATPETLSAFLTIPKIQASVGRYSQTDLLKAISRLHKGAASGRLPLRTAEFTQLVASPPEAAGDLPGVNASFFARTARLKALPDGVARIVLAAKLREVRAQIGFTRLEPVGADLQGEFDLGVSSARLGLTTDWLPATEILGEGVFLQLDEASVHAWEQRKEVKTRAKQLEAGFQEWCTKNGAELVFPGARFYMLHSLAHLLIAAISLECGYSASAIRERIYCAPTGSEPMPMAALLISTGTSGTEGTLGGLVEQGRRIREHLQRAYDLGRLCSNDPVCASHSPQQDRAERFLEGAACHGCLFIAESSCERFNRYLDRSLVVPTLGHPAELAFFSSRP